MAPYNAGSLRPAGVPEYKDHRKYSFRDANVSFIVEDCIQFDIHKHFLQRDSEFFDAILTAPSSHPDGIYRVKGLKVREFESLLDFFYEGMYRVSFTDTPIKSWVNLLSISTSMKFPRVREHAITAIDAYKCQSNSDGLGELAPARMIEMANMYDMKKWLEPAYEALTERIEVIEEEEAGMIGARGVLVIMKAREARLREEMRQMRVTSVDGSDHAIEGKVLPGNEMCHPLDVDSRESCQEGIHLEDEIHETATQSSIDYQPSISAFQDSTDITENANTYSEIKPMDPPVPSPAISDFLDVAELSECEGVVEKEESSSGYQPAIDSSDQRLDHLYHTVLSGNPDHEELHLMLAATLVLPGYLEPTPAHIELLLGLPKGQLVSRFPIVSSMLKLGDREDAISLHSSFEDFLVDEKRAGPFHIDIHTQKHVIARQWLQNLSTKKTEINKTRIGGWFQNLSTKNMRTPNPITSYSPDQLWAKESMAFFRNWIELCTSIAEPAWDILDALWNVNLPTTFVVSGGQDWEEFYEKLVPWVRKYGESQGVSETGEDALDLVERLVHKLQNRPTCFHLDSPWSSPPDNVLYWIVNHATGCRNYTRLDALRPSFHNVSLTECHCDLSGGNESCHSQHLAYQGACLKLAKVYISYYVEILQSSREDEDTREELRLIFLNLSSSPLLIHCRLDTELISLCRMFFGLTQGCLIMRINSDVGEVGRKNMLEWFETFPDTKFVAEREGLKGQVLDLPWEQWNQNYRQLYNE